MILDRRECAAIDAMLDSDNEQGVLSAYNLAEVQCFVARYLDQRPQSEAGNFARGQTDLQPIPFGALQTAILRVPAGQAPQNHRLVRRRHLG